MVDLELPGAGTIRLDTADTRELIELLWGVSAVPGAVVAIGRLAHSITQPLDGSPIRLTDNEVAAIRSSLQSAERLSRGLSEVHAVVASLPGETGPAS